MTIDRNYWAEERILNLADAGTQKRGKSIKTKDWSNIGTDGLYIWGQCAGSTLYRTQVRMENDHFKHSCNCPVKGAAPCKHAMSLMLYWLGNEGLFSSNNTAPDWVETWRSKHAAQEEKANAIAKGLSPEEKAALEKAKAERRQKRLANMQSGMEELELWLQDLVGQGVGNLPVLQNSYWERIAKRMVDAQMPRVSSYLTETAYLVNRTEDWLDVLIARIGELYLLVQAFKQQMAIINEENTSISNASAEKAADNSRFEDLLTALGTTVLKKDILQDATPISGNWLVLAIVKGSDIDNKSFRKIWLKKLPDANNPSAQTPIALLLDFMFDNHMPEANNFSGNVGEIFSGDMYYYPSATPQRAIFQNYKKVDKALVAIESLQPFSNLNVLLDAYSNAIATNFWLNEYFAILSNVYPFYDVETERTYLQDENGLQLDLRLNHKDDIYTLLAMSGGESINIIGSLINSYTFIPFTIYAEEECISINTPISVNTYL